MELKKGQNMIDYEAEIHSRPARTWFQTSKEKEKAQGLKDHFCCILSALITVVVGLSKQQYEAGFKALQKGKGNEAVPDPKVRPSRHLSS